MHNPELKLFIRAHSNLFWYTPDDKKEDISTELRIETIMNYGNIYDIRQLVKLIGIE